MIRVSELKLKIDYTDEDIKRALLKKIHVKTAKIIKYSIAKKSIDARDKNNICIKLTVDVLTDKDSEILKLNKGRPNISQTSFNVYRLPLQGGTPYNPFFDGRIVVAGAGPAGLFAAYNLAREGYSPLLIERGEAVDERLKTVEAFYMGDSSLNTESNVQFGEGGAGTFSDGKLNTGVHDSLGRNRAVLETFFANGAPEEILYESKPHLGTDRLVDIVKNMRQKIIEWGGEVLFNTKLVKMNCSNNRLVSITVESNGKQSTIECGNLILATGHSARDTFKYILNETEIKCEAKAFAVGLRIQHPQEVIDEAQYGKDYKEKYKNLLPPADYKLVHHTADGKNVYSFCMCPGGYIVNSSSEENGLCVNGMSYSKRDSGYANSAIVVGIKPSENPLINIEYQRRLEEKSYNACVGKVPVQYYKDFIASDALEENRDINIKDIDKNSCIISKEADDFQCAETPLQRLMIKGEYEFADLNKILPEELTSPIKEAIKAFGKKIKGFDMPDALLAACETRTSSPLRILRDECFEASIKGIFPCGEGAGYAGGITSAAIDGIKVFEEIYRRYRPDTEDRILITTKIML